MNVAHRSQPEGFLDDVRSRLFAEEQNSRRGIGAAERMRKLAPELLGQFDIKQDQIWLQIFSFLNSF